MPLNTSIPLAVQSVDLAGIQTNALNQQNARQAQEMNKLRFQEEQRKNALLEQQQRGELAKQEAVRNVFSQSIAPTTGQPDMQKVRNALYQIDPQMAMGIEKSQSEMQLTQAKAEHEKNKTAQEQISYGANMLQGANAQNYGAIRAQLLQMGPELDRVLPQQFDPAAVQRVVQGAMTIKDRLALRNQEIAQQLTIRGQDLSAATARRGQDITAAGQVLRAEKDLKGEASSYVSGSDPWVERQTQAILSGNAPYPSGRQLQDPQWKTVLDNVRQIEPGFTSYTHKQRADTTKAYSVGTKADAAIMLNRAFQHLDEYGQTMSDLRTGSKGNFSSRFVNKPIQYLEEGSGNTALTAVSGVQTQLSTELENAYRKSGGTKAGIEHFRSLMDPTVSPAQRMINLKEMTELLVGQATALQSKYDESMGPQGGPLTVIDKHGEEALQRIRSRVAGNPVTRIPIAEVGPSAKKQVPSPAQNSGPAVVKSDADYNALPSGTVFTGPDGVQRRKP